MTENNKINLLTTRYLSGEATNEELADLKKLTESSNKNKTLFQNYKNIWDGSGDHALEKMIDVDKSLNLTKKRVSFNARPVKIWKYWKNIAAVLLIPLIAGNILYIIHLSKIPVTLHEPIYNEIFAAFGTRSLIKLSDGSSLWLNSGSSIRYPDKFISNERVVHLNGEAYFEVECNPDKPFIVETSFVKVRATGTKFNVSSYDSAKEAEVTLVSGKVYVNTTDELNNHINSELNVNQHLFFNRADGTSRVSTEDTYKYIAWKDGKLIFRDEPLKDVVKKIGQLFNVDIVLRGKDIQNYSYRATFQDESLDEILKLLKISSPIDYMEVKRNPLPDNSFPKKKIIIFETVKNKL